MSDRGSTYKAGALMLVAGGLIGAGLALLFAPQSGRATRKGICRYARRARRRGEDIVEDFTDSVAKMVDAVGEKASDILDHGADLAGEARREILKAMEHGHEKLEKQRTRLSKFFG